MKNRYLLLVHRGQLPMERLMVLPQVTDIIKTEHLEPINCQMTMSSENCYPVAEMIRSDMLDNFNISAIRKMTHERNLPNFINEIINNSYREPMVIAISDFPVKQVLSDMNIEIKEETHLAFCNLEKGVVLFTPQNQTV